MPRIGMEGHEDRIMRLSASLMAAGLAAYSILGLNGPAMAADLGSVFDPGPAPDAADQPLEFGTGWYLRGDGAFSVEDHPKLDSARAQFSRDATQDGYGVGLGVGYKLNSFLRVDATGDYLDPYDYSMQTVCGTRCVQSAHEKTQRFDGLGNAYLDLGTWSGITPYVGAGAGVGVLHQEDTVDYADGSNYETRRTRYRFAWAAMAGFSYAITPNLLVDVGYRYLDLGRLAVAAPLLPAVQKDITAHQVRLGVRYAID